MRIVECVQGSGEWLAARCGIPTASRFCDIVTPLGKPVVGKARRSYMLELCGERLTGSAHPHFVSGPMDRGTELEPRARAWYEVTTGKSVLQVGFILATGDRWGFSPDGITDLGFIEIKCPLRVNHLDIAESRVVPPDWMTQIQAGLWITKRSAADFVLWTDEPGMPCMTWPVAADDKMQAGFETALPAFCKELDAMTAKLRKEV